MAWYLNANNETHGPTGEDTVLKWIREGRVTSGKVCRAGSDEWIELTSHLPFAVALREAAPPPPPPPPPTTGNPPRSEPQVAAPRGDGPGLTLLLVPIGAVALMLCAGQYFSLFFRGFVVALIGVGTVLTTAIMMASEATRLEMGKSNKEDGHAGNGPGAWFLAAILLWLVAYPLFLHKRHWYGPPSKGWLGVLVVIVFIGVWWFVNYVTEIQLNALSRQY